MSRYIPLHSHLYFISESRVYDLLFVTLVYLQFLESSGTRSAPTMLDTRRRIDERALEKEEEDYFNEDRCVLFMFR